MTLEGLRLWLRRRLTPGEYFGLELTLGAIVFVTAAWIFGGLAEGVARAEPITHVDLNLARWMNLHQVSGLHELMGVLSFFHTWPIGLAAAGFIAFLLWRRDWRWVIVGLTAVGGGVALNTALKLAFHRERPTLSGLAAALHTYSFPSGHTLAATVLYGVFAGYLLTITRSRARRTGIIAAAVTIVLLVAFSRLYLGVHYLSDVLAAMAEGVAWLALCYTATDTLMARYRRRRAGRQTPGESSPR